MNQNYPNHKQHGMTLVEILIAMLVGAVLLAGILSIFVNSKQTYRTQEALSRLQENGRFAMDFIAKDLRMADYWGCMRRDSGGPTNNINGTAHNFYADGGMDGTQGVIDGGGNSGLDDPDSLTIRGITSAGIFLTADNGVTLTTATNHGFSENDFLFVTDCHTGDIFQARVGTANTTISHTNDGTPGNTTANLSATYGTDSQVYSVSTIVYSIGAGTSGLPSLLRSINGGANQELIEGVENMQILYGVDNDATADGIPNFYVPFNQIPVQINDTTLGLIPGRDRVVSVRISLLLQSIDDNLASQNVSVPYNVTDNTDGTLDTSTADRRLRKIVTSTIALRNR